MLASISKKTTTKFFWWYNDVEFWRDKNSKKTLWCKKKKKKIWDVNNDNIVISKWVKIKTYSKYLIGNLDL